MPPKVDRVLSCPKCDLRITGKEKTCPRCGKKFNKDTKFKCPSCGARVSRRSQRCPSCKGSLLAVSEKVYEQPAEETKSELVKDHAELESPGEEPISQPASPTGPDLVEHETEPAVEMAKEAARPCPACGINVPESLQICPLCDTSLIEKKPEEDIAASEDELSESQLAEAAVPVPIETISSVKKPARTRKLKTASSAPVKAAPQRRPQGRVNGLAPVKRSLKVKRADSSKGEAFVNGTGLSNGLGTGPKGSAAKKTSFLTRWQLIAVLVAIIIIIPTFVFLSYAYQSDKYSIDGNFTDWDDATTYGTKIQSTASTSNITEWSIGTQSSNLYLYLRTQAHIMSSTSAEGYHLFVDSDGSNSTGYVMESIGADYLLQLIGWDSAVRVTSLSQFSSSSDRYNWSAWSSIGPLSHSLKVERLEAMATMPVTLEESAKFLLVSKDSLDRSSISYTAPLKGGVLVVEQVPSSEVMANGVLPKSTSAVMLTLKFTCEGEGGRVDEINPTVTGTSLAGQEDAFSLELGEEHVMAIAVDTSTALDGEFVSAEILASGIVSSFANVEIIGSGASAYVGSPPTAIAIDGAFADWAGITSVDHDAIPATSPSTDIDEVGNVSTALHSYFYVGVEGQICSGAFVPADIYRSSSSGGGGVLIPTRRTAEDVLRIYVDSDRSNSTGKWIALNSKQIGADQLIEVKGLFGRITSMKEYDYSSAGNWVEMIEVVRAAKDSQRIEISVSASSIGGSTDLDFIVETTSWKGLSDLATFDPYSTSAAVRAWVVDPAAGSPWATSMSYQRKMFYDGTNYWSFYFDGANTVYKYSIDLGLTWNYGGSVFTTPGVNETSIWYDSGTSMVYAVGDTSSATNSVAIQAGTVNAQAHTISWAASDSSLKTSTFALAGKNTYICKDSNAYLWILSSNCTQGAPATYQLSAFKGAQVNSTASWVFTGQIMALASASDSVKGSIVPAGAGSNVWAIYAYTGNVVSRKYDGAWQAPQTIYAQFGSKANTDNSPPSVVVDGKGVVHVVYGTGRKVGQVSTPTIEYSHNDTGLTTFTVGVNLDPSIPAGVGDYYPTISLETSSSNLYVLWLRSDTTFAPKTVMARKCVSGAWSEMTIEQQTIFTKQYMTSVYSVPGALNVCWQWTQNTTAPTEVLYDGTMIPEFGNLILPIIGFVAMFAVYRQRSRGNENLMDRHLRH